VWVEIALPTPLGERHGQQELEERTSPLLGASRETAGMAPAIWLTIADVPQ